MAVEGSGPAARCSRPIWPWWWRSSDAVDGWGLGLDSLRAGESFATEAGNLGHALAETHAALRAAFPTARVLGPGSHRR
jgi:hypothetical protein